MKRLLSSFVLGYHGCDETIADSLLRDGLFMPSRNAYDWLGSGIYFWEANPGRALEWATEQSRMARPKIRKPSVVGAIIDLGSCLDLAAKDGLDLVKVAYDVLSADLTRAGKALPTNGSEKLRRNLDCAVINSLHELIRSKRQEPIETVRGIFVEGDELYPGSGFAEKTHVQIAVVDQSCIKGVFRPLGFVNA